jgi:hypothetical protein
MKYGMFSKDGAKAVTGLVMYHKAVQSPWPAVEADLRKLANYAQFAEAFDTVVREMVYDELGFTSDFYV